MSTIKGTLRTTKKVVKAGVIFWERCKVVMEAICGVLLVGLIAWVVWTQAINPSIEKDFKTYTIYDKPVYETLQEYDPSSEWYIPSARELPNDAVWTGKIGVIYHGEAFEEDARITIRIERSGKQYYAEPNSIQLMSMGLMCEYDDPFTTDTLSNIYEVLLGVSESTAINFTNSYGEYDVVTITDLATVAGVQEENEFLQEYGSSDPFT